MSPCKRIDPLADGFERMRILEITFLIDVSDSMNLEGVWTWLGDFVKSFDTERSVKISIIEFSEEPEIKLELGNYSFENVEKVINPLQGRKSKPPGSNLNKAMKAARQQLKSGGLDKADRTIIVITDGWSSDLNTPLYHSELAAKDGVSVFAVGFGPVIMREYLYILTQGRSENVLEVKTVIDLYPKSGQFQKKVCDSSSDEMMNTAQLWTAQRFDIPNEKIAFMGQNLDNKGQLNPTGVKQLADAFDQWYRTEAEFDFGINSFERGLNFTLPADFYDILDY